MLHVGALVLLCVLLALLLGFADKAQRAAVRFPPPSGGGVECGTRPQRPCRVLLVTAHPDDEAMFFVPTIHALLHSDSGGGGGRRYELSLLVLSAGDADGLGKVRTAELRDAARVLGLGGGGGGAAGAADAAAAPATAVLAAAAAVRIVEHAGLRDGLRTRWAAELVALLVGREAKRRRADAIVTFDEGGVSGHANHADTFRGVRHFLRENAAAAAAAGAGAGAGNGWVRGFSLVSTGIVRKYLGLLDLPLSCLLGGGSGSLGSLCFALNRPTLNHAAMAAHASQFVWYRRLFVLFSRYSFVNTLAPIDLGPIQPVHLTERPGWSA
jgi:N-acetylglucosaminylphosphatidylinositol deacetylase